MGPDPTLKPRIRIRPIKMFLYTFCSLNIGERVLSYRVFGSGYFDCFTPSQGKYGWATPTRTQFMLLEARKYPPTLSRFDRHDDCKDYDSFIQPGFGFLVLTLTLSTMVDFFAIRPPPTTHIENGIKRFL